MKRLRRWWRRRREFVDECETCRKQLRRRDVRELRSYPDDSALGIHGGGTYMSAIYCKRHFPQPG